MSQYGRGLRRGERGEQYEGHLEVWQPGHFVVTGVPMSYIKSEIGNDTQNDVNKTIKMLTKGDL